MLVCLKAAISTLYCDCNAYHRLSQSSGVRNTGMLHWSATNPLPSVMRGLIRNERMPEVTRGFFAVRLAGGLVENVGRVPVVLYIDPRITFSHVSRLVLLDISVPNFPFITFLFSSTNWNSSSNWSCIQLGFLFRFGEFIIHRHLFITLGFFNMGNIYLL